MSRTFVARYLAPDVMRPIEYTALVANCSNLFVFPIHSCVRYQKPSFVRHLLRSSRLLTVGAAARDISVKPARSNKKKSVLGYAGAYAAVKRKGVYGARTEGGVRRQAYPHRSKAGAIGNRLAEAQKVLPFGYSGIYGESLEGLGPGEEGKVPTYLEAIANLKDILAYCHIWGRMTFEIGEGNDEAREVVEALDEEAITITLEDSQRIRERLGMPLLSPALLKWA